MAVEQSAPVSGKIDKLVGKLNEEYQDSFKKQNVILSFDQYLDLVSDNPRRYIRNSAQYLIDTFQYFGSKKVVDVDNENLMRFKIFDLGSERSGPIVGGEEVQNEFLRLLQSFVRQGFNSKLILLHGPNGSAKSSSVDTIANAMQEYSTKQEGAAYRFNWIFPTVKGDSPLNRGLSSSIGFANSEVNKENYESYAFLPEDKISSKIVSEFKENPLFLLPSKQRSDWLKQWISGKEKISQESVELPMHIMSNGLSKKNQQIFENLVKAYDGNLKYVFRHIQVERFFYSKQYRVGISCVEPQMSIDAVEKQLTMDRNLANLPSVLQTMSFYEAHGQLVEANRGIIEFSDLLKRPVEAFKYLLSTIETSHINLATGSINLDCVFVGTTNEKHLDSFKTVPDFSSFKGRLELVTVPYLLKPSEEEKIYLKDCEAIKKSKRICPHSLEILCHWAVMTRLKQPDHELVDKKHKDLIAKLDPLNKLFLYEKKELESHFSTEEQAILGELRKYLWKESRGTVVYEGRFGASPREVRAILHKAAQNPGYETVTPIAIIEELRDLVKDRTVYEFLQFEPRGQYHDCELFIDFSERLYARIFEEEVISAMILVEDDQYDLLLKRYVDHVVGFIKKEKFWDPTTNSYIISSEAVMNNIEGMLKISVDRDKFRENMLARIGAYKIENPSLKIQMSKVFPELLTAIKEHSNFKKQKIISRNFEIMLSIDNNEHSLTDEEQEIGRSIFSNLESRYGYDRISAEQSLKFLIQFNQKKDSQAK